MTTKELWYNLRDTTDYQRAITRTIVLPKFGEFDYIDATIAIYPDVSAKQVYITYRSKSLYRIAKVTILSYDDTEWGKLVAHIIMRTRNRKMNPSRNIMKKYFYDDVVTETNKRFYV